MVRGAGTAACGLPPLSVWLYKTWWKAARGKTGAKMVCLQSQMGSLTGHHDGEQRFCWSLFGARYVPHNSG
jgi:hypothetical protein